MNKEKYPWTEIFTVEFWKKRKKTDWVLILLTGVLLLVITMPTSDNKTTKKQQENANGQVENISNQQTADYRKELEQELRRMLQNMQGIGKVEVMITLQDTGEKVIEKDVNTSIRQESAKQTEKQTQENSVYQKEGDASIPYVTKETKPAVEGVLIVAQGGGSAAIQEQISRAVLALFSVEAHKIVIVEMKQ